jgi:hypothetical protein
MEDSCVNAKINARENGLSTAQGHIHTRIKSLTSSSSLPLAQAGACLLALRPSLTGWCFFFGLAPRTCSRLLASVLLYLDFAATSCFGFNVASDDSEASFVQLCTSEFIQLLICMCFRLLSAHSHEPKESPTNLKVMELLYLCMS